MRRLTTLISDTFVRRELPAPRPAEAQGHAHRVFRRRLSDRVEDVFHEACLNGDLETAEELLAVLEAMHNRRQAVLTERRMNTDYLVRARDELSRRKMVRDAAKVAQLRRPG